MPSGCGRASMLQVLLSIPDTSRLNMAHWKAVSFLSLLFRCLELTPRSKEALPLSCSPSLCQAFVGTHPPPIWQSTFLHSRFAFYSWLSLSKANSNHKRTPPLFLVPISLFPISQGPPQAAFSPGNVLAVSIYSNVFNTE